MRQRPSQPDKSSPHQRYLKVYITSKRNNIAFFSIGELISLKAKYRVDENQGLYSISRSLPEGALMVKNCRPDIAIRPAHGRGEMIRTSDPHVPNVVR
jgi:hypothetical protein